MGAGPGPWHYTVAGTFVPLNNIANGTGLNERVGSVVRYRRLTLRGSIINDMTGNVYRWPPTKCRTLVIWDRDSGSGDLNTVSLFSDPAFPASSQLNLDNRAEHVVIMDHLWCSGYIHTVTNIVDTFWTLQPALTQSWAQASWPNVAAYTTNIGTQVPPIPGVSAVVPVIPIVPVGGATAQGSLVPHIDLNDHRWARVNRMGPEPQSETEGVHNPIITYVSGGKSHKKMHKDFFLDLFSIHANAGAFPIKTGKIWLVTVRDPYPVGVTQTSNFTLEGSARLRFVDK